MVRRKLATLGEWNELERTYRKGYKGDQIEKFNAIQKLNNLHKFGLKKNAEQCSVCCRKFYRVMSNDGNSI
jgi:hypothetical protein